MQRHLLFLLIPMVSGWALVPGLSPPIRMIAVALTMFVFIKTHLLVIHFWNGNTPEVWLQESLLWFFAWPGLNTREFFDDGAKQGGQTNELPTNRGWPKQMALAICKTAFGLLLLVVVAPRLIATSALLGGWVGMVGIVFTFHFGIFHLSAVWWQLMGRPVEPIMNAPLLATTISEFWSKRWNLAFRDYAHLTIFKPVAKRLGGSAAIAAGFLFSGVVHDLAISLPAGGGYGWPTLYFIIQGVSLLMERKLKKSGVTFDGRIFGHVWTLFWVAGPAFILFHQPFVLRVIVPIVKFMGTLGGHSSIVG